MVKKKSFNTLVYSTDPDFKIEAEDQEMKVLHRSQQNIRLVLDKKQRAGKVVTIIEGFIGNVNDLEMIAKQLKSFCGTGGSVKDQVTIIQGDNKEKIFNWLIKEGYLLTKKV